MKVLRVICSMDPKSGGPCQGIRNSIPALQEKGVENEVLCFDAPDADYLGSDNFPIYTIGPAKGPYAYCPKLKKWLLDNMLRYDVVMIHGLWLYHSYGTYKIWMDYKKRNHKVPRLYVMPHGMLDPYFQKAKGRKIKAIRNWFFWKLIERHLVNESDGLLFTCEEELLLARKTFSPYKPKQELNIGYGILPPPEFKEEMTQNFSEKCEGWNRKPFFLFLSRIHEKKGVDMLVKVYLQLYRENPDIPQLVIAGPGLETPYGQHVKALTGGNNNILFPGMLSGETKWGAFYNCEVFVLPSHQENFGIAIVEAMACQKAVLITDKVNIWREIANGDGGLICSDTIEEIYDMLSKWLSLTNKEKENMNNSAGKLFFDFFGINEFAKKLLFFLG
ncbi:glycosyltransferase involved in cell wall biosynthesis [Dysgonomonas sp. PFB1-18]|uniref:glycosyltransferase n=1 Tax=unclassified Dysgonomonas TaxID=2630389 RepID=UPI002475A61A|nr:MULTISPECIES: glycosyltransferase [unclassified Dysgonomonas]MDH6308291.1 glycosyltransferase involved in cell wall biosynthesis [Dysgonomonas sp. PF1-14]MDH6338271.1 glycosyltransferase involved in cell wall biosynthesis [Dysgonomonas sp. PF1-16]MDH6379768.1 glycosyltransferase involved in cell wall biosynthesis [Dysgonomonas sp. PFB1-18]MDH6397142.1 glycosyltransferase involved in cell wall biosynthesis [Dysgonomonas sp. PF1-23]